MKILTFWCKFQCIFSCDQASTNGIFRPSVRPSVRLSVTPFWLIIGSSWNFHFVHANFKCIFCKCHWWCNSLNWPKSAWVSEVMPYCFSRSSVKFQGHIQVMAWYQIGSHKPLPEPICDYKVLLHRSHGSKNRVGRPQWIKNVHLSS